jgi:hypothetical protein
MGDIRALLVGLARVYGLGLGGWWWYWAWWAAMAFGNPFNIFFYISGATGPRAAGVPAAPAPVLWCAFYTDLGSSMQKERLNRLFCRATSINYSNKCY